MPFIGKAFHIDDPLYLWAARQIQFHPLDFYGFPVQWYEHKMPMFVVMKNPPLASYFIAVAASLFGYAEIALHTAFLIPAVFAAAGTYYLAKEFCSMPLAAALAGILSPVFIISGTTVMGDIMMMSFWVWAAFIWIRGIKNNSIVNMLCAALLTALCSLTKYFGMSLILLLFIYSLVRERKLTKSVLLLLLPVFILAAYQWATSVLYGRGLLLDASSYALSYQNSEPGQLFEKGVTGLLFTGGCFIPVLFYALYLLSKRAVVAGAGIAAMGFFLYLFAQGHSGFPLAKDNELNWLFVLQCVFFLLAGAGILLLAASDLYRHKNADSLFLFLWIAGVFLFAGFLNWTVNARSVLPMFPAIGILIVRRIEETRMQTTFSATKYILLPLIPALLVALSAAWADYMWSDTVRKAAVELGHRYANNPTTAWFEGHWGFQYYLELYGGRALDEDECGVSRGDIVIIPSNDTNTNIFRVPEKMFSLVEVYKTTPARWVSTLNASTGAGFYSSDFGPLPFVFGPVPDTEYIIVRAISNL